ncbi:hypothetical protein GVY41_11680 [Frigidibacter albus]|uniref:Dihydroorotate dehydrogenase n=1 Tax=Frigidibacter albus TaxID=1465486 RepID=A0A6L8VJU1_9RHOB|nr:hypothetical protein [Frigidibacter albus]MZQ89966.1 hypothetical protein [Frigidibacter albus]NBE31659.1 hypothetical protein [Frigidibacter albus]GGH55756.1 hypothetical protein GCM10011341_23560 [Frigidibacter albus]
MTMADPHKMTETDMELEAFFSAGRAAAAEPSAAFLARVLAEAEAVQAGRIAPAPPPRQGIWAGVLSALGGWGGAGGLATATIAGVWLGFAGVQGSGTLTAFLAASDEAAITLELIPDFDSFALAALETEG